MSVTILSLLILFFLSNNTARAAQIGQREILPGGMILLHSEKTSLPIITAVVIIKAGSVIEPSNKAGLANLTADLLNEGTKKRSSKNISEEIEFVGGTLGTSGGADYITVTLSVLKKDIDLGFDLLSDIILNPSFDPDEISRRKEIIKNSILRQKEDPGAIASKAFRKAVFGDHPYGRPTEGTEESLDGLIRSDLMDFHSLHFTPDNTIMAIVGDMDRQSAIALVMKYFGSWKGQKKDPVSVSSPSVGSRQEVIKINKNLTQSNIILGHLGISRDNPDYYALSVMNYILGGGGFSSRLMDNIRDDKGLAYDVHSSFSADKYSGSFQIALQTKNQSANSAINEILKEMQIMRTEPVSDKELNDSKSFLLGSFPLRIDSNAKIARFMTAVEYYGLGLDYADNYKKLISAITKDDILRVARKYLHPEKYVLVLVGDTDKAALAY